MATLAAEGGSAQPNQAELQAKLAAAQKVGCCTGHVCLRGAHLSLAGMAQAAPEGDARSRMASCARPSLPASPVGLHGCARTTAVGDAAAFTPPHVAQEREAKLAGLLRDRLALHATLGRQAFEARMGEEARRLSKFNFGPEMLQVRSPTRRPPGSTRVLRAPPSYQLAAGL